MNSRPGFGLDGSVAVTFPLLFGGGRPERTESEPGPTRSKRVGKAEATRSTFFAGGACDRRKKGIFRYGQKTLSEAPTAEREPISRDPGAISIVIWP